MPGDVPIAMPNLDATGIDISDPVASSPVNEWFHAINYLVASAGIGQVVAEMIFPWGGTKVSPLTTTWRWRFRRRTNADAVFVFVIPEEVASGGGVVQVNGVTAWRFASTRDGTAANDPSTASIQDPHVAEYATTGWVDLTIATTNVRLHSVHAFVAPRAILDLASDLGVLVEGGRPDTPIVDDSGYGMFSLLDAIQNSKTETRKHLLGFCDPNGLVVTGTTKVNPFGAGVKFRVRGRQHKSETSRQVEAQVYASATTTAGTVTLTGGAAALTITVPVGAAAWAPAAGPQTGTILSVGSTDDLMLELNAGGVSTDSVTLYSLCAAESDG